MGLEALYKERGSKVPMQKHTLESAINEKFKGILPDETIRNLLIDVDTNISLKDVILSDENKEKIRQLLVENNNRSSLLKYGLHPMNRILTYGASGCGKTFMGKALSNELGYTMLYVDISQCIASGKVAQNLSDVFKLAAVGHCLIFLDECDSIAWNRDASENAESGDVRRATNSLFQLLDQLTPDSIILCATNMLNRLDPAFERRFDLKMEFRKPNMGLMEVIKKFKKPGFMCITDVSQDDIDIVQNRLTTHTKLSYYELQCIVERAMKKGIITKTTVTKNNKTCPAFKLSWILDDLKVTLRIKRRFGTHLEEEENVPVPSVEG